MKISLSTGSPALDLFAGMAVVALFALVLIVWDAAVWLVRDRNKGNK